MSRKTIVGLFVIAVMLFSVAAVVMAQEKPVGTTPVPAKVKMVKPEPIKAPGTKPEEGKAPMGRPEHHMRAANSVDVCACGMVFKPNANTKFFTYEGKDYACCSDGCHEMGMKDPAKAAKMADDNMAKMMAPKTEMK
jgi:hypothetical protein